MTKKTYKVPTLMAISIAAMVPIASSPAPIGDINTGENKPEETENYGNIPIWEQGGWGTGTPD